jgi:hypothetical protein
MPIWVLGFAFHRCTCSFIGFLIHRISEPGVALAGLDADEGMWSQPTIKRQAGGQFVEREALCFKSSGATL